MLFLNHSVYSVLLLQCLHVILIHVNTVVHARQLMPLLSSVSVSRTTQGNTVQEVIADLLVYAMITLSGSDAFSAVMLLI